MDKSRLFLELRNNPILLKNFLDEQYHKTCKNHFLVKDPLGLPHLFSQKQDIEIVAFFAAILAWGNRKTIINNVNRIIDFMHRTPYDFIKNHQKHDLNSIQKFSHRTFNLDDLLFCFYKLNQIYSTNESLEQVFDLNPSDTNVYEALIHFNTVFTSNDFGYKRINKHLSNAKMGSACKRLNMFLRWMVRKDQYDLDFGIWKSIKPNQLICPLDVHVLKNAFELGLISQQKANWKTALELSHALKEFDPIDPIKYDFALFGLGVNA